MLSAFLAAVVPASIASRQDVVAVLAGRRGDRQPSLRSPLLGLVLLGVGIAGAVAGAGARNDLNGGDGSLLIAGSAVVSVLGMILVVPVVVAVLARLARRLPLVARYAVRDAARHRTRTVPAVAAVAATVAGVVALGIANASDAAESEATYTPQVAMGMGTLTVSDPDVDWARYQDAVHREAPTVGVTAVTSYDPFQGDTYTDIRVKRPEVKGYDMLLDSWGGSFGNLLVGPEMLVLATPAHEEDLEPRAPDAGAGRRGGVHHRARRGRPDPDQRLGQPGDGRRRARAPRPAGAAGVLPPDPRVRPGPGRGRRRLARPDGPDGPDRRAAAGRAVT